MTEKPRTDSDSAVSILAHNLFLAALSSGREGDATAQILEWAKKECGTGDYAPSAAGPLILHFVRSFGWSPMEVAKHPLEDLAAMLSNSQPKIDDHIPPNEYAEIMAALAKAQVYAQAGNTTMQSFVVYPPHNSQSTLPSGLLSLSTTARNLAERITGLADEIVKSFALPTATERILQIGEITNSIAFDALPIIAWIERNRPASADLEKRRLQAMENDAERCAAMDIPEYKGGFITPLADGQHPSEGSGKTGELLVFCHAFGKAILGWADEIEKSAALTGRATTDNSKKTRRNQPDNPDVRDLCHLLDKCRAAIASGARNPIDIAREFTNELPGKDSRAKNLLRQARRYSHLWRD